MPRHVIRIRGACQHNLKRLDLDIPAGQWLVLTGVSGSGKSSLAFDTLYAEGQRRYVETFSAYARQFLERMDRPRVERIEGIPPAIAIDQTNPVRTSRSTVGTMTELAEHLKLLYARAATLHCPGCGRAVRRDSPQSAAETLLRAAGAQGIRAVVCFPVPLSGAASRASLQAVLTQQGFDRIHRQTPDRLEVVAGRVRIEPARRERLVETLETAFRVGHGHAAVWPEGADTPWRFSDHLHCPHCDRAFRDPTPALFSFNNPVGACPTCRGFGRVIDIDPDLVVPDASKSLADGAVRPFQSPGHRECQDDLLRFARARGIPVDRPWSALSEAERRWVWDGEGDWDDGVWYGVRRFFDWLEGRAYRMHVRVLLSRYRTYRTCPACRGARLRPEALWWRLDTPGMDAAGPDLHTLNTRSVEALAAFFARWPAPRGLERLVDEIRGRLGYLLDVGLGYLTLDRQSRTLSGGEVQRIHLTTALGTALVHTLFVLDEPSIGLHPRDLNRLVDILRRLRDRGNTLVVVEHDPQVMLAADRIVDLGPGPGQRGGRIRFDGPPAALLQSSDSATGRFLSGRESVHAHRRRRPVGSDTPRLHILGATAHNLRDLDVALPLNRLVCLTGVSGSGKSTLLHQVLYRALQRRFGRPTEAPGPHRALEGAEGLTDVVLVDQSPIGRTARSTPASYMGAFDAIRKRFAALPEARSRGWGAGRFSFNAGKGRCPACGGTGFEHVEMQFLADVYLRCPICDGRRYRPEVLEVRLPRPDGAALSVADVLELTVAEALRRLADWPEVTAALRPLAAVGLEYLRLGQPVPTLSGGEAQRLKLAARLGARHEAGHCLFLLDEPTTGLHFADVARLLRAFEQLLEAGHSLVVIEHHLDVIRAADWVVDLGPEGGEGGGRVVCAGPPEAVAGCAHSHTGAALRGAFTPSPAAAPAPAEIPEDPFIRIHNAREHNLQGIDVAIPHDRLTVVTGVSGSGKSTLAFDILFQEGQRRYLESLNAYARQIVQPAARAEVDATSGIPPTVAIAQRTTRGGRRSTVATLTEIDPYTRLLWTRLGVQYCPDCELPIEPREPAVLAAELLEGLTGLRVHLLAPLVRARKGVYRELAAWAARKGFGLLRVDGEWLPTEPWPELARHREHTIELPLGEIRLERAHAAELRAMLDTALEYGKGVVRVLPAEALEAQAEGPPLRRRLLAEGGLVFSTERSCPGCGRSFEPLEPRLFSFNSPVGWCPECLGTGVRLDARGRRRAADPTAPDPGEGSPCPACRGRRLRPEALAVRLAGRSLDAFTALSVEAADTWLEGLELDPRGQAIARDLIPEIRHRLAFLHRAGLGYLTLDRAAPTLSGGEAQRIRLAAQLGSNLRGVCYVLDEPTIGLHPRDNARLVEMLRALCRRGNTVVVVEHDEDTIRAADHVLDLGPGGGPEGGRLVAEGSPADIAGHPISLTGRALRAPHRLPAPRRPAPEHWLRIRRARRHNLRGIDVAVPLHRLVCVTGVSGSGKSTLVREVLEPSVRAGLEGRRPAVGCAGVRGLERVGRVLEVDQSPIGRTPRSCPATFLGLWTAVRRLFADTAEARIRGFGAERFSFNKPEGRCPECEGQGLVRLSMNFLPDVVLPCETCGGTRFNAETLEVRWRGRHIGEVLALSVEEAAAFFHGHSAIQRPLELMREVGLGYLRLGQQSPTLSGGEAQRLKLVKELAKSLGRGRAASTLYLLDEPTVGLHMHDVARLTDMLERLVEAGHSVVVIEHNLELIARADWIIDLGPEGGDGGGRVVCQGAPRSILREAGHSHTAAWLGRWLDTEPASAHPRSA